MNDVRLIDDIQTENVIINKPKKAYFYILVSSIDNITKKTVFSAERVEGLITVCRYHGAEIPVGFNKQDGKYRVWDLLSGAMLSIPDDIKVCRGVDATKKRLPMIISRWINYMEKNPRVCRRYHEEYQPRMACELIVSDAAPEYKCFYQQYAISMQDWAINTELDAWSGGAA